MKKILLICLLASASCTYHDRSVNLNLTIENAKPTVTKNVALEIRAFEHRKNSEIIGTKEIGDQTVKITSNQNLAKLLEEKIAVNLVTQGFKIGNDKKLNLYIEDFSYSAKRAFFIGKSEAKAKISAVIKDNKGNVKFTKNFEVSSNGKHFISSCSSTDNETINQILNDIASDIVKDKSLIANLEK